MAMEKFSGRVIISHPPQDKLKVLARRLQTLAVAYGLDAELRETDVHTVEIDAPGHENSCFQALHGLRLVTNGLIMLLSFQALQKANPENPVQLCAVCKHPMDCHDGDTCEFPNDGNYTHFGKPEV